MPVDPGGAQVLLPSARVIVSHFLNGHDAPPQLDLKGLIADMNDPEAVMPGKADGGIKVPQGGYDVD